MCIAYLRNPRSCTNYDTDATEFRCLPKRFNTRLVRILVANTNVQFDLLNLRSATWFAELRGEVAPALEFLLDSSAVLPSLFATFDAIDSDIEDTEFAADAVRSGEISG